jgi:hypothetical protein
MAADPEDRVQFPALPDLVDLERGPLSLASTNEELLERRSGGSGLESQEHGRRDSLRWPLDTLSAKVGTNFADKLLLRHQNAGENRDIKIANRSFENMSQFK